jgi:glucarate dehydratase
MRRTREKVRVPLATNTVVVNFEQLAANVLDTAVDVILLDTTFWGGIRACVKAAAVCETFNRSGSALLRRIGIQLATMLHRCGNSQSVIRRGRALIIWWTTYQGGLMQYQDGAIRVHRDLVWA